MKNNETSCSKGSADSDNYEMVRCPDTRTNWVVMIFLVFYVLLTNLLLFNLLIAIFTSTYEKIEGSEHLINILTIPISCNFWILPYMNNVETSLRRKEIFNMLRKI